MPDYPRIVTTSEIKTFRTCQRLWKYKYVDRVRMTMDSKALLIGDMVHQALEIFWRGGSYAEVFAVVLAQCTGDFWESETGKLESIRVRIMLEGYWRMWRADREDWELIDAERTIWTMLDERRGIVLAGKADAIARYRPDGRLFLLEHKTSSESVTSTGDDYWQRLKLDTQISVYKKILEQQFGEPVYVMYDVLRKITKKPKLRTAIRKRRSESQEEWEERKAENMETLEEFSNRIVAEINETPEHWYVRREVIRLESDAEIFDIELAHTIEDMFHREQTTFPRNDAACMARFGVCPYLNVCCGSMMLDDPRFVHVADLHPELEGRLDEIPTNTNGEVEQQEERQEQEQENHARAIGPVPNF